MPAVKSRVRPLLSCPKSSAPSPRTNVRVRTGRTAHADQNGVDVLGDAARPRTRPCGRLRVASALMRLAHAAAHLAGATVAPGSTFIGRVFEEHFEEPCDRASGLSDWPHASGSEKVKPCRPPCVRFRESGQGRDLVRSRTKGRVLQCQHHRLAQAGGHDPMIKPQEERDHDGHGRGNACIAGGEGSARRRGLGVVRRTSLRHADVEHQATGTEPAWFGCNRPTTWPSPRETRQPGLWAVLPPAARPAGRPTGSPRADATASPPQPAADIGVLASASATRVAMLCPGFPPP